MSHFPQIDKLDPFKAAVGDKPEIKHMLQANGYTVTSYIVSMDSTWDSQHALECRGLVFNPDGHLVARPLHKFFNLNEKDGARPHDFDWHKLSRVMDKRDGSMIHTVAVDVRESPFSSPEVRAGMPIDQEHMSWGSQAHTFTLKSKKSFESDVAVQARKWMATRQNYIDFCQSIVDEGYTAIFEWTSPTARIVLPYSEDMLTLLHVRDNATGEYWQVGHLMAIASQYNVPVVQPGSVTAEQQELVDDLFVKMLHGARDPAHVLKHVQELQETVTNVEGWIFQFQDGRMVKVKTKWYMERHRAMTFLRERDIVNMVLEEGIDDLKALLQQEGVDVSEIIAIENRTVQELLTIQQAVEQRAAEAAGLDFKTAALKYGPPGEDFEYFSLLMSKLRGKEPNYKDYYASRVLSSIPLRQLNLTQSVAEAE